MATTEKLSTLKIHKLSQEQYERELQADRIDESAIYLTPDEEVVSIAHGGTGATTASDALNNLGAASVVHNHSASNITSGTLSVARGGTGATTASDALIKLGVVSNQGDVVLHTGNRNLVTATYIKNVVNSWTQSGNYYYQDITVVGMLETDNPIVGVAYDSVDNDANVTYDECFAKVLHITTSANSIRVWATEAISTAFPIQLKVVR